MKIRPLLITALGGAALGLLALDPALAQDAAATGR